MLRIQYLDKDRFMRQVAASKGSVYLHLDNGETCDLKKRFCHHRAVPDDECPPPRAFPSAWPTLLM